MNKSFNLIWIKLIAFIICINLSNVFTEELEPIKFANYLWDYKIGDFRGPGPNIYRRENIFVDKEDRLHLYIRKDRNQFGNYNFSCAEVYTRKTGFGYGLYSFTLETDVSNFDPSVVVGLYTWDNTNDTDTKLQFNREVDIEFSKWNNKKDKTNAQFVVQPYYLRTNIVRFAQPSTNLSIHEFLWTKDNVRFRSLDTHGNILNWDFNKPNENKSVLIPGHGTSVRINLWLWKKIPPSSGKDHHIIISDFSFTPINNLEYFDFD